jgi:glycosyltransferase involved in cell wall biosynthesis
MYIGNLEIYQGIDLLLNSFAMASKKCAPISMAIIGGTPSDIRKYEDMAGALGVRDSVRFLGPKPVSEVAGIASAADVLVSPRITGVNTPMKIYAYLNSGRPILATDIESHTQVLSNDMAVLKPVVAEQFAEGICLLASDPELRRKLSEKAAGIALEKYSSKAFERTVGEFCSLMESLVSV